MDENLQGAEMITGEVAPPQGAEESTGEVAQSQALDMNDADFNAYINGIKSGTQAQSEPTKESEEKPEEADEQEEKKPFRSFETREEFQSFMNHTVGERLKASKEAEKKYAALEARAKGIYADDDAAIERVFAEAERQRAEEIGQTVEEFQRQSQLEHDAALWRESVQEQERQQRAIAGKQEEWQRDEEQLRQVIPDFDFMRAMENKDFASAVINDGMSVAAAYIKVSEIGRRKPQRPEVFEVASAAAVHGAATVDPLNMNDADFSEYIRKIKGGK